MGEWDDWGCDEFEAALDLAAMDAALQEIWERCQPQCDRRALYVRGGIYGSMVFVPIPAGMEAMAVVREHFNSALARCKAKAC